MKKDLRFALQLTYVAVDGYGFGGGGLSDAGDLLLI